MNECGISSAHFFEGFGIDELNKIPDLNNGCVDISSYKFKGNNPPNILRISGESSNVPIPLGNNDVLSFEPSGFILKNRVQIKINNAITVSPVPLSFIRQIFDSQVPAVYTVMKYPISQRATYNSLFCNYIFSNDCI